MSLLGSVSKRKGEKLNDRVLKIGWLSDYVDADIMKELGTRTNHVFEFAKYREKPLSKDVKKAENQVQEESIKKQLTEEEIQEEHLRLTIEAEHANAVTGVNRMIRKARVTPDKLNQLKAKMMEMTKGQFMTEGQALAFILATSGRKRTGKLTNFNKHPLSKQEIDNILKAIDRFESSQKFTESGFLSRLMLKSALPETVAAATPVTKKMYEDTVHLRSEAERVIAEFNGYIDTNEKVLDKLGPNKEIIEKAFKNFVISGGKDVKNLSKSQITRFKDVYYGDGGTAANPKKGSVKWITNKTWDGILDGMFHQYLIHGEKPEIAKKKVAAAKKQWYNEAYWPGYVTNLEKILMYNAERRISDRETIEDLDYFVKNGHLKKKTLTIDEQKDRYDHRFKEVMTTSVKDALEYAERQRQTLLVNNFLIDLEKSSGKYKEVDLKGWNSFFNFWKVWTDDILGYTGKVRNPKYHRVGNNFYVQYSDWNGNVHNKPISAKDEEEAKLKVAEFARHARYKANIARYMTSTLVNLSFAKYIGWKLRSSVRNATQGYIPVIAVAGFSDYTFSRKWLEGHKDYAVEVFDKAGLGFGLSVGETDLIQHSMRDALWAAESTQRVKNLQAQGKNIAAAKEGFKSNIEKLLQWGMKTSGNLAQSGSKMRSIRGSNESARYLSFLAVEERNRRRAFIAGFARVYDTEFERFKQVGLSDVEAKARAEVLAMEAGKNMVIMTQFDYHTFAKPAALRGNKKKMWLMFKTFSWNYYKLNKDIIRDGYKAATGQYGNEEDIRRVARLMFAHSFPRILTSIFKTFPFQLGYYFTDDTYVVLKDLYKLLTEPGKMSEWAFYGAGPLSVLAGAVAGNVVDLATVNLEDRNVRDAVYRALPVPNAFKDVMKTLDGFMTNNSLWNFYRIAQLFGAPPKTFKEKGDIDENRFLY
jgi:hypothetical protein